MGSLIVLLLVVAGFWAAAGAVAKWIGRAESVTDGMKKLGRMFCEWWSDTAPPPVYPIEEQTVRALAEKLNVFFGYLIFEGGSETSDSGKVTYLCDACKVDQSIIKGIFQKFVETFFPPDVRIETDAYIEHGRLVLIYAITPDAITKLHTQRINRAIHQIPHDDDLVE